MSDTKTCTMCGQPILLRPDERDVCAGCELRGGPPPKRVVEVEDPQEADARRVKAYLARMTPEERQYHIDNMRQFNPGMAEDWRRWNDELVAEAQP